MAGPLTKRGRSILGLALFALVALTGAARAQIPYIGEIRMFAGDFAPKGWAFCDGRLLPVSSNTALFSLLGTTYGGDGRTTFALPDLRGRFAGHPGRGPGLTARALGEVLGTATHTLSEAEMPAHSHGFRLTEIKASSEEASSEVPSGGVLATTPEDYYATDQGSLEALNPSSLGPVSITNSGAGQPFSITPPGLGVRYIIALQGIYPPRG